MRRTALLLFSIGLGLPAASAVAQPASGRYGSFTLAIADGVVSGAFSSARMGNGTEAAPQFTCVFLLRGRLRGDRAEIETWYPGDAETIPGVLTFSAGQVSILLREEHGGCAMTVGGMVREPVSDMLDRASRGWRGATLVTAPRAVFRAAPDAPAPRAPYVVRSNVVVVLERRPGWVRASYLDGARPVTGWLRAGDLAPEAPPGAR